MKLLKMATVHVLLLFLVTLTIAGCGGGGAELRTDTHSTTMGQELMDLQKAKQMGLLSEDEYEDAKEKILERE